MIKSVRKKNYIKLNNLFLPNMNTPGIRNALKMDVDCSSVFSLPGVSNCKSDKVSHIEN